MAIRKFIELNESVNEDKCLDGDRSIRLKDEAREEIQRAMPEFNLAEIFYWSHTFSFSILSVLPRKRIVGTTRI